MVADIQKSKQSRRFTKLSAEEKVVATYNDILSLAQELGVTLPPR